MGAEYERQLLTRARRLLDLSGIRDDVLGCLGAARHAGLDPEAIAGLVGCAAALGADSTATYSAGDGWAGRHRDERDFLGHICSIEDDLEDWLAVASQLGRETAAALESARADLEAAYGQLDAALTMPTGEPCDGCHGRRDAAIAAARRLISDCETRTGICEEIGQALDVLTKRLRHALARLRAVPSDLGETYESVYSLIRRGGRMPHDGRWITGEEVPV